MYRSRFTKIIVFVLLIAGVLQAGVLAYSAVSARMTRQYAAETPDTMLQSAAVSDNTVQEVETTGKEIDISRITLSKEVEDKITSLDAENAAKNINNYKLLLAELNVPAKFQAHIEAMFNDGHKVQEVLAAYEYLYQNYGSIEELEGLIKQKEDGKAWKTVFKEYKESKVEFEPSSFPDGKLEEIMQTPGITPDDVIIADRVAQMSGLQLDELFDMRRQGKAWKVINEEIGIINTSGELPRAVITSAQVKNHMKSTGLSEEKVIEALVLAQKLETDGKTVVDKIKAGSTEEDIIAESLEVKYQ